MVLLKFMDCVLDFTHTYTLRYFSFNYADCEQLFHRSKQTDYRMRMRKKQPVDLGYRIWSSNCVYVQAIRITIEFRFFSFRTFPCAELCNKTKECFLKWTLNLVFHRTDSKSKFIENFQRGKWKSKTKRAQILLLENSFRGRKGERKSKRKKWNEIFFVIFRCFLFFFLLLPQALVQQWQQQTS